MSFSNDVRIEVAGHPERSPACRMALLSGMVAGAAAIKDGDITIRIENEYVRKLFDMTLEQLFGDEEVSSESLSEVLKLKADGERLLPDPILLRQMEAKRAFIKGMFLAAGSVSSPERKYHFEMNVYTSERYEFVKNVMADLGVTVKHVRRNGDCILYLKDSESIIMVLGMIGAPRALMEYENARILKDIRNSVNRSVNCDTANTNKTANAAAREIEYIEKIEGRIGLGSLSKNLRDIAEARLNNPYLSLKELGEVMSPPVSKSAVSHRMRRIKEIAEKLG